MNDLVVLDLRIALEMRIYTGQPKKIEAIPIRKWSVLSSEKSQSAKLKPRPHGKLGSRITTPHIFGFEELVRSYAIKQKVAPKPPAHAKMRNKLRGIGEVSAQQAWGDFSGGSGSIIHPYKDDQVFHAKLTFGALRSAGSSILKSSAGRKPNMPAKITLGKTSRAVLYCMTESL